MKKITLITIGGVLFLSSFIFLILLKMYNVDIQQSRFIITAHLSLLAMIIGIILFSYGMTKIIDEMKSNDKSR